MSIVFNIIQSLTELHTGSIACMLIIGCFAHLKFLILGNDVECTCTKQMDMRYISCMLLVWQGQTLVCNYRALPMATAWAY